MKTPIVQQELYQVVVVCRGKHIPVGPRVKRELADTFAATIRKNIAAGRERDWCDPQVIPCSVTALH
jgi:hypothetical protein